MNDLAPALAAAELVVIGRLRESSNLALLCEVEVPTVGPVRCIYKPASGERPLWDFPGAVLAAREVLAARVADALGWGGLLPTTVWREDGPAGPGMCQEWITAADPEPVGLFAPDDVPAGWQVVAQGEDATGATVLLAHEDSADLRRVALLDALINNGDRKGGHVLRRVDGTLAVIDHGVSFHEETKLRSVLWGWVAEPIDEILLAEMAAAEGALRLLFEGAPNDLTAAEHDAFWARRSELLAGGTFPEPSPDWPALPWPPL